MTRPHPDDVPDGPSRLAFISDPRERREAEQVLRESEATLRAILDASTESIWLFSADGIVLAGNQTALARWGRPPDQVLGRHIQDLAPDEPDLTELLKSRAEKIAAAARSGRAAEFEDTRAGRRYLHSCYPVVGPGGHADRIAVFSSDITARRDAEETARESASVVRRYELLAAHSRDVILFVRLPDGRILEANAAALETYGYSRDEILAMAIHDLRAPETHRLTSEQLAAADESGLLFETVHRCKDGRTFPVEVSSRGATIDGTRLLISVVRDISERKRADQALRDALDRLEEADRRKNDFLAVLSHELRNPLMPIGTGLHLLEHAAPASDTAARARDVIRRQTVQLVRLVDDLLDITRITHNKIRLQRRPIDLNAVVGRTVEDHRTFLEEKGIHVRVVFSPQVLPVDGDSARVSQIVGNLLQNASKFTLPGGTVSVRTSEDANWATVEVADTGVGIEPALLRNLFQPFMQAERTLDRTRGGLGLGLALVKSLTELHGGRVRAESAGPGQGSQFTVELPLLPDASVVRSAEGGARPACSRRVLVIEDNVDAALMLRTALELGGHVVRVAHDGSSGLAEARTFGPEFVLCDIGLPGLDGFDVARAIRADETLRGVVLVALSGYAFEDDVRRAEAAGFDRHIAKPASPEALERLLQDPDGPRHGPSVDPAMKAVR